MEFIEVDNTELTEAVAALARAIWEEYYTPIIGGAQVAYMLEKFQSPAAIAAQLEEGTCYYLLRDAEGDVGYIAFRQDGEDLFFNRIYVLAHRRRKGAARQALGFVEKKARALKCRRVTLTVNKNNTSAIQAYEHMGFQKTAPVIKPIGGGFVMDDFEMAKPVGAKD